MGPSAHPDRSAVLEIARFRVHSAEWGQFLQAPNRRMQRSPMKHGSPPPRCVQRLTPFASACLLASASACATLSGNGDGQFTDSQTSPAVISGLPTGLSAAASRLVLKDEGPSTSVLQTRNRADRQAGIVREFLAAEGYLAAEVEAAPISDRDQRPELLVTAGEVFRISRADLDLRGDASAELQIALGDIVSRLGEGSVARTVDIERIDQELLLRLRQEGHAFAESVTIDAVASRRDATLDVTFEIDTGPLVRLGELQSVALDDTRPELLATLKTWTDGAPYRPATIDRLRTRLRSTGIFDGIGVELSREPDRNGNHPVILRLAEAKRSTIGAGITASTSDGLGADIFWERRNITGKAQPFFSIPSKLQ